MDPEVGADLLRLVHGEQDIQFVRPLSPWELVYPVAIFDRLEKKASGELIYCRQKLWSGGELVAEIVSTYFIRGQSGGSKAPAQASEAAPEREYLFSTTQAVAADQPVRYGHASGDINPIHMDDGVARAAGHPSIILHGLCTMAFVGKAVVDSLLEGDATRLKRLRGRFSRVVLPADVLTIRAWDVGHDGGRRIIGVEATNQKGQTVFANGLAEML
jgi:acyl dehydratase